MKLILSKSAIEAAILIAEDKEILDVKKRKYIESVNSTLDYTEGKKLIELLGKEIILKYLKEKIENKKLILREILKEYLVKVKPGFFFHIIKGRNIFLDYINENIYQLFNEADLFREADESDEFKEIYKWWDELNSLVRKINNEKNVELGRTGELKSLEYESEKLIKLKSNKRPYWASLDNNLLGYDIESWDENNNKIYIEAKSSSHNDGIFYLSRNEWNTALEKKDKYLIQIWIKEKKIPISFLYQHLVSDKYKIHDTSKVEWQTIRVTP